MSITTSVRNVGAAKRIPGIIVRTGRGVLGASCHIRITSLHDYGWTGYAGNRVA